MSAFVVSDECMGVILAAIKRYADQLPLYFGDFKQDYILNWLGNNLLKFNHESVNSCYNENDEYIARELKAKEMSDKKEDLIKMAKQVHCWKYQSCNVPGYFYCWPFELMQRLDMILCREILQKQWNKRVQEDEENHRKVMELPAYKSCPVWG